MSESIPNLEYNCFLFYNKQLPKNVISAWGTGEKDFKAGADPISLDQIWITKPDPHFLGYFYLENVFHPGPKLAAIGSGELDLGLVNATPAAGYNEHLLWKFEHKSDDYFEIVNRSTGTVLDLWDEGKSFGIRSPGKGDSQQWKFEPRYKCEIEERELYRYDNSGNNQMSYQRFELTLGVKLSYPDYLMKTSYSPLAVENAMALKMLDGTITFDTFSELKTEQWRTLSKDDYDEWYEMHIVPLNAYPNRKYRVTQFVAVCTGKLDTDKLEVLGPWKCYNEF